MSSEHKEIHNLIILDESGSMEMIKQSILDGFNSLAHEISASGLEFENQRHLVSLSTFNGGDISFKLFNQPAEELISLNEKNYFPGNTTPLYDAICKSVLKLKHELYCVEDYVVLVTVLTDGAENSSQEFSLKETRLLIENLSEDSRWGFGLIGANILLEETAEQLSIPIKRTIKFETNRKSVDCMMERYRYAQSNMAKVFDAGGGFDEIPF